jgi:hypothetical protein
VKRTLFLYSSAQCDGVKGIMSPRAYELVRPWNTN